MQYTQIRLLVECDPILMDSKDFDLLNLMCQNLNETGVTVNNNEPHKLMVCCGSYKPQCFTTHNQALKEIAKLKGKQLAYVDGFEIHTADCVDIQTFDEKITYRNVNSTGSFESNDIAFSALLSLSNSLSDVDISNYLSQDALSLFTFNKSEPLINHFLNRTGILAAKTHEPLRVEQEHWFEQVSNEVVNNIARKTY
ncbi:hypothetical protein [Photobacterium leiognathi]|uniref:hypothetical protein n=1 Tax=Photobacterium leiognathi TaxID=553611 RepID=UPI002738C945|nr:hypothetical protein [Photobacterium leiognathi]